MCLSYSLSASPQCSCDLGFEQKIFKSSFLTKIIEKTRVFREIFCFHIRISSLNTLVVNIWYLAALHGIFQTVAGFRDDKFFLFQLIFEVGIVTLILRCYLLVVLFLVSPDFATCSLALHKHVVSDVIKRLVTFSNLALSTLAPMFLIFLPLIFLYFF